MLSCAIVLGGTQPAACAPSSPPTPHEFLERLCDDFGGRATGSVANAGAMERLAAELRAIGYDPEFSRFSMPGWERGEDRVELLAPIAQPRRLRVAALSYTQQHPAFEADVIDIKQGREADYPSDSDRSEPVDTSADGRIGLLAASTPLRTGEIARIAAAKKLRGILFINREGGGQLLARTGNMIGKPLPLPIYSLTQEEGLWLQRLLARGARVRVSMETKSRCREVNTANLVVRIPGRQPGRIVVGAHFDSWDLGQGAMDNGLGIAQLYALAQALRGAQPEHTVELVWFNGEEQGLWGSRHEAARLGDAPIVAMINLDMVGVPIAVNALGDDSLVPALERWHEGRERKLAKGVQNINWLASDHTPYQLAGARTITFNAPIPRESVRYYHDFADTIDKVSPALVHDSAAVVADLVRALANDRSLTPWRRSRDETEKLFTRFGLERRMKAMGLWPFDR